jgi:hypothetical protein
VNFASGRNAGGMYQADHWREWFRVRSDSVSQYEIEQPAEGIRECDWDLHATSSGEDWELDSGMNGGTARLGRRAFADRRSWLDDDPE